MFAGERPWGEAPKTPKTPKTVGLCPTTPAGDSAPAPGYGKHTCVRLRGQDWREIEKPFVSWKRKFSFLQAVFLPKHLIFSPQGHKMPRQTGSRAECPCGVLGQSPKVLKSSGLPMPDRVSAVS